MFFIVVLSRSLLGVVLFFIVCLVWLFILWFNVGYVMCV